MNNSHQSSSRAGPQVSDESHIPEFILDINNPNPLNNIQEIHKESHIETPQINSPQESSIFSSYGDETSHNIQEIESRMPQFIFDKKLFDLCSWNPSGHLLILFFKTKQPFSKLYFDIFTSSKINQFNFFNNSIFNFSQKIHNFSILLPKNISFIHIIFDDNIHCTFHKKPELKSSIFSQIFLDSSGFST